MAVNTHSLSIPAGTNNSADIADASQTGLDLSGDFTLEGYFYLSGLPTDGQNMKIIAKWYTSNAYLWVLNKTSGVYKLRVYIRDADSTDTLDKTITTPSLSTWYHWAVAWTASTSTVEYYINGVSQGTTSGVNTCIANASSPFQIGRITDDAPNWNGLIDEVRVWNVKRTTAQILANYQRDVTGQTGLQGYWKLNNGYTDSSPNGNTLSAVGSPTFSTTVPFVNYVTDGGAFLYNIL